MNEKKEVLSIPYKSIDLERKYNQLIADYGFKYTEKENEQEETYRTGIRRQRDKILYTGGFRRLQDKTQVMPATLNGDHRTRLTHTLEVEQIAISVADALSLNKDLVSAIALGHDVGHTPFGHAAERTLDNLLKENGGFHHPIQSVKYLWNKYGSKLINEIYEGILLHDSDMYEIDNKKVREQLEYSVDKENNRITDSKIPSFFNNVPSTLEAQVVIWADKIAYITHDLEDFINSSIFNSAIKVEKTKEEELINLLIPLITMTDNRKKINSIKDFELRDLLRNITTNLIITSANNIKNLHKDGKLEQKNIQLKTNERVDEQEPNKKKRFLNSLIINFEDNVRDQYYKLRFFLDKEYIFSPEVQKSDAKAQKIIFSLFNEFKENYKLAPLEIRKQIDSELIKFIGNRNYSSIKIDCTDLNQIEKDIKRLKKECEEYEKVKKKIISRYIATYISTMSDTYAENEFYQLNAGKNTYTI